MNPFARVNAQKPSRKERCRTRRSGNLRPRTHPIKDNTMEKDRPFVYLCTAMSLDGKIASHEREQTEIATNDDREMLYDNRVKADAVMVGGRTLLLDDPALTVKTPEQQKARLKLGKTPEPWKVAVISDASNLKSRGDFFDRGETRKIIFTTERTSPEKTGELKKHCDVHVLGRERVDLKKALSKLRQLGIKSLMVEGGGELIFSLLKENLVDEINLKIGNLILGGRDAPTLADGEGFTKETARKAKLVDVVRKENYLVLKYRL